MGSAGGNFVLKLLSKFNRTVESIIKPLIAIALLLISTILCFNVIGRYIFGFSIKWAEELANYTIVYITFFGAVNCLNSGMHISMDAVVSKLGAGTRNFLEKINAVIGMVFSFALSVFGYQLVMFVAEKGQLSPAMMIPMVIPYMAIPTASLFMGLEFLEKLFSKK